MYQLTGFYSIPDLHIEPLILCLMFSRYGRCLALVVGGVLVAMAVMFISGWYAGKHDEHHQHKASDDLYDNGRHVINLRALLLVVRV